MGGDGGTLNNTRAEHAHLRRSGLSGSVSANVSARAPLSHYALSQEPLRRGEVIVDRTGALYNKSALLAHLLDTGGTREGNRDRKSSVPHIHRLARDVADVRYEPADGTAIPLCALTRAFVRPDGTFSVGWRCGCVSAAVDAGGARVPPEQATQCANCGASGERIPLGATKQHREQMIHEILAARARKKKRKSRPNDVDLLTNNEVNAHLDGSKKIPRIEVGKQGTQPRSKSQVQAQVRGALDNKTADSKDGNRGRQEEMEEKGGSSNKILKLREDDMEREPSVSQGKGSDKGKKEAMKDKTWIVGEVR